MKSFHHGRDADNRFEFLCVQEGCADILLFGGDNFEVVFGPEAQSRVEEWLERFNAIWRLLFVDAEALDLYLHRFWQLLDSLEDSI